MQLANTAFLALFLSNIHFVNANPIAVSGDETPITFLDFNDTSLSLPVSNAMKEEKVSIYASGGTFTIHGNYEFEKSFDSINTLRIAFPWASTLGKFDQDSIQQHVDPTLMINNIQINKIPYIGNSSRKIIAGVDSVYFEVVMLQYEIASSAMKNDFSVSLQYKQPAVTYRGKSCVVYIPILPNFKTNISNRKYNPDNFRYEFFNRDARTYEIRSKKYSGKIEPGKSFSANLTPGGVIQIRIFGDSLKK